MTASERTRSHLADRALPSTAGATLSIRHVTKIFKGDVRANDDISLEIEPGEVFGLLGPNGAGKTTLVNQIVGLLKPTSGTIHLGGVDLVADPAAAREFCSYLPQTEPPIRALRVTTAIDLVGRMRGGDPRAVRERMDSLIHVLELEEWRDKLGDAISGGVRRLVGFVMAAVQPGHIVILDEPTNDVDPLRRRLLWREIRGLAERGAAVILVTHNVLEAEHSVDRLAIIDRGRVIAQGTPSSLKADGRGELRFVVALNPLAEAPAIPDFARQSTRIGRRLLLTIEEDDASHAMQWARTLISEGIAEEYELGATTLEDTYVRLIGREDAAEMAEAAEADNGDFVK